MFPLSRVLAMRPGNILQSGNSSSTTLQSSSHPHSLSDSEDDDDDFHDLATDAAHHDDFVEVDVAKLDPLRKIPLAFILAEFASLVHDADNHQHNHGSLFKLVDKEHLPRWRTHCRRITTNEIWQAFSYVYDDSGRVPRDAWRYYVSDATFIKLLPVPRMQHYNNELLDPLEQPSTWPDYVRAIEWYRSSLLPMEDVGLAEPCSAVVHFRLEDPLDPLNLLLLIETFEAVSHQLQQHHDRGNKSHLSAKQLLVREFAARAPQFGRTASRGDDGHALDGVHDHDHRHRHNETEYLALDQNLYPRTRELYAGFLLWTQGPPALQRHHAYSHGLVGATSARWLALTRRTFGLNKSGVAGLTQRNRVFESMSWAEWRVKIIREWNEDQHRQEVEEDYHII
ncbi:hypothetical protein JCM8547_003330 [Rhodosporidiobolus lusitaniae]